MKFLNTLFLILALLVSACAKEEVEKPLSPPVAGVPATVLAALVLCIVEDECYLPSTTEEVNGEELTKVMLEAEKGGSFTYFYTNTGRFGVTTKTSAGAQVLVEDLNLDGKVDRVTKTVGPGKVIVYEPDPLAQLLYENVMRVAEQELIPPEILDLTRDADKLLKEGEKGAKKYSV